MALLFDRDFSGDRGSFPRCISVARPVRRFSVLFLESSSYLSFPFFFSREASYQPTFSSAG